jgi:hypothetical protein
MIDAPVPPGISRWFDCLHALLIQDGRATHVSVTLVTIILAIVQPCHPQIFLLLQLQVGLRRQKTETAVPLPEHALQLGLR